MGTVGNKSRTGMTNSPEMRKHISEALMGTRCGLGNKSRTGQKRSPEEIAKGIATRIANGNHIRTAETRAKISKSHKGLRPCLGLKNALGYRHTDETKRKMSETRKGRIVSEEGRHNMSMSKIGHAVSEEQRCKTRKYWAEHKEEHREIGRRAWANNQHKDRIVRSMLKARLTKPNKIETTILEILDEHYPSEWSYVGDGTLVIGGKCPDFSRNHGHNHLIEFFGTYWHAGENEQDRIDHFRKHGYETIVIWEHETDNKSNQEIYELIDMRLKELPPKEYGEYSKI